jgi:hypothetical protein
MTDAHLTSDHQVAALYVAPDGPYCDVPGVEPWTAEKDARRYNGPYRVIAHPPCERWGRYWGGGPSARVKRKLGDDDGCFEAALAAVRRWGGLLEHPEASHAWHRFGLNAPPKDGGWIPADFEGGWTCCVEQGHYGHRARKATWLYAKGIVLRELMWGPSKGERLDEGFHSTQERRQRRASGQKPRKRLSTKEKVHTPIPFRDLLLSMVLQ